MRLNRWATAGVLERVVTDTTHSSYCEQPLIPHPTEHRSLPNPHRVATNYRNATDPAPAPTPHEPRN